VSDGRLLVAGAIVALLAARAARGSRGVARSTRQSKIGPSVVQHQGESFLCDEPERCKSCGSEESMMYARVSIRGNDNRFAWLCFECDHAHPCPEVGSRGIARSGRGQPVHPNKRWQKSGHRFKRLVSGGSYVIHRRHIRAPFVYDLAFYLDEARLTAGGVLDPSGIVTLGRFATFALADEASDRREAGRGSRAFVDEGFVNGHWGSEGAGLLVTDGRRMLLLRRSWDSEQPETWGIPGGAVPVDEETGHPRSPRSTAIAEAREEMSHLPAGIRIDEEPLAVYKAMDGSGFRYTTFLARCKPEAANRFSPTLNDEHDDWGWFEMEDALDLDLHPGVRWLFARLPS